jgi:hypothetical protein
MKKDKLIRTVVAGKVRKTKTWFFKVVLGFLLAGLIFLISVWFTAQELVQNRAFEFLTLFRDDLEILKDYWQTTLVMVWEELPRNILFLCDISIVFLIALFIFLRKKFPFIGKVTSFIKLT